MILFCLFTKQRFNETGFTHTRARNVHLKLNDNVLYWVLTYTSKITRKKMSRHWGHAHKTDVMNATYKYLTHLSLL